MPLTKKDMKRFNKICNQFVNGPPEMLQWFDEFKQLTYVNQNMVYRPAPLGSCSADDILYAEIGCVDSQEYKYWERDRLDGLAEGMGFDPNNFKNKKLLKTALDYELPNYLNNFPEIKSELKTAIGDSTFHPVYLLL